MDIKLMVRVLVEEKVFGGRSIPVPLSLKDVSLSSRSQDRERFHHMNWGLPGIYGRLLARR